MTGAGWRIRPGSPVDRELLASFACADPAVRWQWQGRSFASGERASDVLMSAVMTDVSSRVPPRDARVYAIVHEDNHRSLAVCHRHGLTEEMSRPHPSYRRIVTPHKER